MDCSCGSEDKKEGSESNKCDCNEEETCPKCGGCEKCGSCNCE